MSEPDLDPAIRMREQGENEAALGSLRALVTETEDPRAWYELGRAFRGLNYHAAAHACFARALGDRDEDWETEGMYDPSLPLTLGVEDAEAWVALARLLLARGELEAGVAAADRAVFLGSGDGWLPKALGLSAAGRTAEALRALEQARERGVERGSLVSLEVLLRRQKGDVVGERRAQRRLRSLDPGRRTGRD